MANTPKPDPNLDYGTATYDQNGKLVKDPWSTTWWASLGLPADVSARLDKILTQYTNQQLATAAATTYLRGTQWYAQTFPGIEAGRTSGITPNEATYRAYVNDFNNLYQQYLGRPATARDVQAELMNGRDINYLAKYLQGNSYALANKQNIQALAGAQGPGPLSGQELQAYGQAKAGVGSALGDKIQVQMEQAAKRLQGVFQGVAGNASVSLGPQGPFAQTLQGSQSTDVGA